MRTGNCLHCEAEVLLERANEHREFECPVYREDGGSGRYLPLEFMGVGPAGPDYDECTQGRLRGWNPDEAAANLRREGLEPGGAPYGVPSRSWWRY